MTFVTEARQRSERRVAPASRSSAPGQRGRTARPGSRAAYSSTRAAPRSLARRTASRRSTQASPARRRSIPISVGGRAEHRRRTRRGRDVLGEPQRSPQPPVSAMNPLADQARSTRARTCSAPRALPRGSSGWGCYPRRVVADGMKRSASWTVVAATLMAGLLSLGGCLGLGCPCGTDPSKPLREHDPNYAGRHVLELECQCQCGDDPLVPRPRDRGCREYETSCVDRAGERRTLLCE